MSIKVDTANYIHLDGNNTGYQVTQGPDCTIVHLSGVSVPMPHGRYALSCDKPASGIPGRADFERDIRATIYG